MVATAEDAGRFVKRGATAAGYAAVGYASSGADGERWMEPWPGFDVSKDVEEVAVDDALPRVSYEEFVLACSAMRGIVSPEVNRGWRPVHRSQRR